jgi:UDP-glucuronate decarboxylase
MRILVTGAAGFIGSHLTRKLLKLNHEIIGLDNMYSGRTENLSDLVEHDNFVFIEHDVTKPYKYEVDFIFNLACPASPVYYQRDPVATVTTNVLGAINGLNLAKEIGCGILQASTSEVYGDPLISPQKETYLGNVNPIGIRACYDEGKRLAETLFFDYHRQFGTKIKVVRIFNSYGPAMRFDDGRVVSNFIYQALNNQNLTIYGDGLQTRSFCYVDDLVAGLISMMNSPDSFLGPVNLGNPDEFTVLELAKLVIQETKSSSAISFEKFPDDDPKQRKPDIELAKKELCFNPAVRLKDGLNSTIQDFSARMGKNA